MAGKRFKAGAWEYVIKRSKMLDAPVYLRFDNEADGDRYVARIEAMLDAGRLPDELQKRTSVTNIQQLAEKYLEDANPSAKDQQVLRTVVATRGMTPLHCITANWVDSWVEGMKLNERLAPATIRAKVGALARACDWGMRKDMLALPDHPLRSLPDGYSQYNDRERALTKGGRHDVERDRRLEPGEHERIMDMVATGKLHRTQRPLHFDAPAVRCMYMLGQETAMRMREIYTLSPDQVDIPRRTIFLDRTKNGSKRQVPLSSVAIQELRLYGYERGESVFPWWNGRSDQRTLHRTTDMLSNLFIKIFEAAGCDDLGFHDLRHEATCRLFERTNLSDTEIMKITGHKSHRMMMRYANLRASNLAEKLW